jgi:hypothetical protein
MSVNHMPMAAGAVADILRYVWNGDAIASVQEENAIEIGRVSARSSGGARVGQ